ncbi:MAG: 4Fe-4S dicluster domain-containing protein, partial [Candidatus Hydrogenedentes bacterium]|nr:4Fe-4S dicluster domain-containing protein [Candidatus Hydrogenedentota bacterium]
SETFEKQWNRVLHDGLLGDSATPSVGSALRNGTANKAFARLFDSSAAVDIKDRGDLELVFTRSLSVFDGRFANNGWLQEMPDTITKLTWGNAAVMSPKTARSQGLRNEDVVRLRLGDRSVEAPVWIVPGHADESVSVALGYGRTAAGRIGNDCGTDVYVLRTSDALGYATGLRIEKTGQTHVLAGTQDHSTMDGRGLVREASLAVYKEHPNFAHHEEHGATGTHLFRDPVDWTQGRQWGMTIDLNACTGCNACLIACQSENNISIVGKEQVKKGREMHWIRIDRYFTSPASDENRSAKSIPVAGEHIPDDPQVVFQPMPCQHCETAPCEQVCPVAATVHDREGLNVMVYNRCIGTRYCANNCPYKVRRFNYFNLTKHLPESVKLAQNPDVTVRSRGIMEKCSFCLQRISEAKIQAKRERRDLRDGEIQTACQQACPAQAIQFGNINDAASAVARNKRNERNYVVLGETNMRPRVSYLAKVRNPNPDLAGGSHSDAIG